MSVSEVFSNGLTVGIAVGGVVGSILSTVVLVGLMMADNAKFINNYQETCEAFGYTYTQTCYMGQPDGSVREVSYEELVAKLEMMYETP